MSNKKAPKASDKKAEAKKDPAVPVDHNPQPRVFYEKIGHRELEIREEMLDPMHDLVLWDRNPRLQPQLPGFAGTFANEDEIEAALQRTSGYAGLAKSIEDIGQLDAIYVWKRDGHSKYLVLEGASRVTIFRQLARKLEKKPSAHRFHRIKAKVLPPDFTEIERAILLARIHVRGSGVRPWDRYVQAEFIYNHVSEDGNATTISVTEMAYHMGKSVSWVQRLRDAYLFARKFVEHMDSDDAVRVAAEEFSTLEEIMKVSMLGPKLRAYNDPENDALRAEVFDMVQKRVFAEYRDARFLKELHDDPEKWALLKTGEKHIARKLAADLKTGSSSVKARIAGLEQSIERAFERDPECLNDDDAAILRRAAALIDARIHPGVRPFRAAVVTFTNALVDASLSDVRSVQPDELARLEEAYEDVKERMAKHPVAAAVPAPTAADAAVA